MFKSVICCCVVMLIASQCLALPDYRAFDLGSLGVGDTYAYAINESGTIVGESAGSAFVWQNGTMTDLGTLGGATSAATSINNHGLIVGYSSTAGGDDHAFSYQTGVMADLGTLGGNISQASCVNDMGVIVGVSKTSSPNTSHAFKYYNGVMTDLPAYADGYDHEAWATGINNNGLIVGVSKVGSGAALAVVFNDGSLTHFASNMSWNDWGTVHTGGVNDSGTVVGFWADPGKAFICYGPSATGYVLPDLGGTNSWANDINNLGQVVGGSQIPGNAYYHATFYQNGSTIDLSPYLAQIGLTRDSGASAINSSGSIVGNAVAADGQHHAFLLVPTPEPATLSILVLGGLALLRRRKA